MFTLPCHLSEPTFFSQPQAAHTHLNPFASNFMPFAAPVMVAVPMVVAGPPALVHYYPSTNSSTSSGILTQLDDTTSESSSIPLSVGSKAQKTMAYWMRLERIGWGTIIQNAQY
jgi:hypothetical protein